jgi:hypothetical protein
MLRLLLDPRNRKRGSLGKRVIVGLAGALLPASVVLASDKGPALNAVELYQSVAGPAWVEIGGVSLNGRTAVRVCPTQGETISRSEYGKLARVTLAPGMTLERGKDGALSLVNGGAAQCVIPAGLRLEKEGLSATEMADKIALDGQVLGASDGATAVHPLDASAKLIFVENPDRETADYLLASRENTIPLWTAYLKGNPQGAHAGTARKALSGLITNEAQAALARYRKSTEGGTADYSQLKQAREGAEQARSVQPDSAAALALLGDVGKEVDALATQSQTALAAYREALKGEAAGTGTALDHLQAAQAIGNGAVLADPGSPRAAAAAGEAKAERDRYTAALQQANAMLGQKQYDGAVKALGPYRVLAPEDKDVAAVVAAAYSAYLKAGQQAAAAKNWRAAEEQFGKANAVQPTAESKAALKDAHAALEAADAQEAANMATQRSQEFEADKDPIDAYQTLYDLPPAQRKLVADRMEQLQDAYVKAASEKAGDLRRAHEPINGIGDESGILSAYQYLQRCYEITGDAKYQDGMSILGNELSAYDLQQGRQFLGRPSGTGTGVGWMYLSEALKYKGANVDAVRDEMTRASGLYQVRSQLSVRVDFRDRTAQRNGAGFANQLGDELTASLENWQIPVKVIRAGENTAVQPNFQIVGDVLQAEKTRSVDQVAKESKYRAGEQSVPNPAWVAADQVYETAQLAFETAQKQLEGATARGKKKEIKEASAKVEAAQKQVVDAHSKLDGIPKALTEDIDRPYSYTEQTVHLGDTVDLQFRVLDQAGNPVGPLVPIRKSEQMSYSVLQGVKAEDTQGVRSEGQVPDEMRFVNGVENEARKALISAVRAQIAQLPPAVLAQADRRASDGDTDGAAELYILYLNSTPDVSTPERAKAQKFLKEKFLFQPAEASGVVAQAGVPAPSANP